MKDVIAVIGAGLMPTPALIPLCRGERKGTSVFFIKAGAAWYRCANFNDLAETALLFRNFIADYPAKRRPADGTYRAAIANGVASGTAKRCAAHGAYCFSARTGG